MRKNQRIEFIPLNSGVLQGEIWKDVIGYEGLYQVSNLGRIRRLCGSNYNIRECGERNDGYCKVTLSKNNKREDRYVHRMVAQAFLPNPYNLPCINHKDENKKNNNLDNLEWCTHQYNSLYGTATKRQKEKRMKNDPQKKGWRKTVETRNKLGLSKAEIPVIVERVDGSFVGKFRSLSDAAKSINASVSELSLFFKGKRKSVRKHVFKKI